MSWSRSLTGLLILAAVSSAVSYCQNPSDALWREFGMAEQSSAKIGTATVAVYRMKDVTGAIAAWEWQRGADSRPCTLATFCSTDKQKSTIASGNYLLIIDGAVAKGPLDAFLQSLPNRHDTSLPAILTFVPRKNLVPNSARYVLGPESLKSFAQPLAGVQPGFDQGAEAEIADYKTPAGETLHLAIFYYPTPEMARIHFAQFKGLPGVQAKRSGVLLGLVFGGASAGNWEAQANTILSQVEYEAKVTWNDTPPPSPIKPLYQLLRNIIFLSVVLSALCFVSGLIYAGIRLYRRRFGTLEEDESMTTLHLSGR